MFFSRILISLIHPVGRFAPVLSAELTGAAEDARGASMPEDISFSLPDNFVRPFREETDSRNEYKSQVRILGRSIPEYSWLL